MSILPSEPRMVRCNEMYRKGSGLCSHKDWVRFPALLFNSCVYLGKCLAPLSLSSLICRVEIMALISSVA